ncbi:MAG: hypothetical protein COV36_03460 [Alphaproteobacteria bacterium CG11_big_fil_rev_8_21_14_0_20_44_7]|nr:MAG: hypothetical protein COV36_03460 [Alphaproteobacteria bacterium CG11_big_fil_rev_8_21_14_0_20_44_7]
MKELKSEKGGKISFDDISNMMISVIEAVNSGVLENSIIFKELEQIKVAIEEAKGETATILHDDGSSIPDASSHLDEVIKDTVNAANVIIDSASDIMELAGDNEEISAKAMIIIENCDFGDLSRQRLIKVLTHLDNIETRLDKLFAALELERKTPKEKKADGISLTGPQLAADAPSQDDIDALFDSL